jgi:hypothetical protein
VRGVAKIAHELTPPDHRLASSSTAWVQMFGEDLVEADHFVIIPYWVDAYTVTMYLIDSTVPPPEEPATVLDLLEDWSITSGTLQGVGNYWNPALSQPDGSFARSIVWGWYERGGPPQLLIGAIASWGDSGDPGLRGMIDVFVPLESEADIADYQTTVFPPISDWTLEQVANMLAQQLAGLGMMPDEPVDDPCAGEEPGDEGLNHSSLDACLPPPIAVTSMHPCHAAFKTCARIADLQLAAAYEDCDSDALDAAVVLGIACNFTGPGQIVCGVVAAGSTISAYRRCKRAARLRFQAAMQACYAAYNECCQSDPTCPFR